MTFKEYFISLTSANSLVSSKRVTSLLGTIMLMSCTIINFWGVQIQPEIIYALVSIILGASVMTLITPKSTPEEKV